MAEMSSKAVAFSIANLLSSDKDEDIPEESNEQKNTLDRVYTIQNLLQSEPPHATPLTPRQSSFPNCFDFVRGFDFTSSNLVMLPRREIQVALQQSDLWWKFYACGTEMVITRTGR